MNLLDFDGDYSLPYRGSHVLLGYDAFTSVQADAPTTWDALVAWIKADPGPFIYSRADKGGSGGKLVRRTIHQAKGLDPAAFTVDHFTEAFANEAQGRAWAILSDIAPSLYDGGAYTSGHTQSIQLFSEGVVPMAPACSDQVLPAIAQGVLSAETGLVQLTDLSLVGGFSRSVVMANGVNRDAMLKLVVFILTEEIQSTILSDLGGFAGVGRDDMSGELREHFAGIELPAIPTFPGGPWEVAINDGWYRNVAPNVDRSL